VKVDKKPVFFFFTLILLCPRVEIDCIDARQDCTLDAKPFISLKVDHRKIP
jgi:hypothetical protein